MKVFLARHYLIPHAKGAWLDAQRFAEWSRWYDAAAGTVPASRQGGATYTACWSSDLHRAMVTASSLHAGEVVSTPMLREVPFAPVWKRGVLPLMVWQGLARAAWWMGHRSQPEPRAATRARAAAFVDELLAGSADQVLVVAHGFMMHVLAGELRRRGFRGRLPLRPRGGVPYPFERDDRTPRPTR